MRLNRITLLCHDVDAALAFYRDAFGFMVVEDTQVSQTKRIVLIASEVGGPCFNLVEPKTGDRSLVGMQTGQRVSFFLDVDNLDTVITRLDDQNVPITDGPRTESFGRCLLVQDLSGNTWEFVERITSV